MTIDLVAGMVYWWQSNAIRRANLDGTAQETIWPVVADYLVVDPVGGKIYWSNLFDDKIRRGNVDATGSVETIVSAGLNGPNHLALDLANSKLYVQDTSAAFAPNVHRYRRYNLDGTGHELLRDYTTMLTAQAGGIALGPIPEPSTIALLSLILVYLACRFSADIRRGGALFNDPCDTFNVRSRRECQNRFTNRLSRRQICPKYSRDGTPGSESA